MVKCMTVIKYSVVLQYSLTVCVVHMLGVLECMLCLMFTIFCTAFILYMQSLVCQTIVRSVLTPARSDTTDGAVCCPAPMVIIDHLGIVEACLRNKLVEPGKVTSQHAHYASVPQDHEAT